MTDPDYYQGEIKCIDVIDQVVAGLHGPVAAYVASIQKYIWRWNDKGGVKDLKKAKWFLDRLINMLE